MRHPRNLPGTDFLRTAGLVAAGAIFAAALTLATVECATAQPGPSEEKLDYAAANPVIQAMLNAAIANDSLVEYAYPTFDAKESDLTYGRLKYDLVGQMKNPPWAPTTKAKSKASSTYSVGQQGQDGWKIGVRASAENEVDTLAAIRYFANLANRKRSSNPKYDARIEAHLKRLGVVRTLEELKALLVSGQTLAHDIISDQVNEEQERLDCMLAVPCRHEGTTGEEVQSQRDSVHNRREALRTNDEIRFSMTTAPDGKTPALRGECDYVTGLLYPTRDKEIRYGHVVFTATLASIDATTDATVPINDAAATKLRARLIQRIKGLAVSDPKESDAMQRNFREALIAFRETIAGEKF